jgi:hypothetical protein
MEKLLARIKALFAPGPVAAPPAEVDLTATPVAAPYEAAEARSPEPIVTIDEPPVVLEAPVLVAETPVLAEEAPTPIEAADTEEAASEQAPEEVEPAPADGLTLRLETERGSRSTFQVTKSGATIGRGPESTIQLADLSVSRKHARIAYRQGAYWLSDLGSMGGTWVDGTKLAAPRRVATGQTIDIGVCRLRVVAAAEGEKTGAAKGPSNAA